MRVRRTMFSLSPFCQRISGCQEAALRSREQGQCRASITNDHLDFPKLGGFGRAFQDAGGEFL